jgi:hypothetical protein
MRDHLLTREDSWTNLGSMGEIESGQCHQVWWHRERHEGRLVPWEVTPMGWVCSAFPMWV